MAAMEEAKQVIKKSEDGARGIGDKGNNHGEQSVMIEVNHSMLMDDTSFMAMPEKQGEVAEGDKETKGVSIFAETELDLNKTMMIRKIKKERKRANLTAMLSTVKRRKDRDLVDEARAELNAIDREIESMPAVLEMAELSAGDGSNVLLAIGVQVKRFNPEIVRDWESELLSSVPAPEPKFDEFATRQSQMRRTETRPSIVMLRDYLPAPVTGLAPDCGDLQENLFTGLEPRKDEKTLKMKLDTAVLQATKAAEESKIAVKNVMQENLQIAKPAETKEAKAAIAEADILSPPPKSKPAGVMTSEKKENKQLSPILTNDPPEMNYSDEPDMMRLKKNASDPSQSLRKIEMAKSKFSHSSKKSNPVCQSLTPARLQQLMQNPASAYDDSQGDRVTIKKRTTSFEKARKERLLDDEQLSSDLSQYSAFDSSQSSDDESSQQSSKKDSSNQESLLGSTEQSPAKSSMRLMTKDIQSHVEFGLNMQKTLKKAMEDARATMITAERPQLDTIEEEMRLAQFSEQDDDNYAIKTTKQLARVSKHQKRKFKDQGAYLESLITASRIIEDRNVDGTNIDTITKAELIEDIAISTSTIIPLLLVDGDPESRKITHCYLVQDSALDRQRTALNFIMKNNTQKHNDFFCIFKLAIVYFLLNKHDSASGLIQQAVQCCPKTYQIQKVHFWKGLIFYYYLHQKRKDGFIRDKPKAEQQKFATNVIKQCEECLKSITLPDLFLPAKYILLKLLLMLKRERFGCDLSIVTLLPTHFNDVVWQIRNKDQYFGQLAKVEVYLEEEEAKLGQAFDTLIDLMKRYPQRIEAYLKMWSINYELGNFHSKKAAQAQKTQDLSSSTSERLSERVNVATEAIVHQEEQLANECYTKTVDTAQKLLVFCTDITETNEKLLLLLLITIKGLFKTGAYIKCFELLQKEFTQNPNQSSLLYYYGKYVVKAMAVETKKLYKAQEGERVGKRKQKQTFKVDRGYLGSGIGALEECLRVCIPERHKKVNFYIGFAYKILSMPLKTFGFWNKAYERGVFRQSLSARQYQQVKLFQNEFQLFNLIGDKATEMIKSGQFGDLVRTEQQKNQVKEYLQAMHSIEKVDRPNSLLFQAQLLAYCVETMDEPNGLGKAYEALIQEYPSFIDAYLQYWRYLKFRLGQLSGRALGIEMTSKVMKVLKKQGIVSQAALIVDRSGVVILDKMHEIAEQALLQSQCTEVPTSLCVQARIIYAKQLLYEKNVEEAIRVLHEICYILPQLPIEGLSYVDTNLAVSAAEKPKGGMIEEDGFEFIERERFSKIVPSFSKRIPDSRMSEMISRSTTAQRSKEQQLTRLNTMLEQSSKEAEQVSVTLNDFVSQTKSQLKVQPEQDQTEQQMRKQRSPNQPRAQPLQTNIAKFKSSIPATLEETKNQQELPQKLKRTSSIYNPFLANHFSVTQKTNRSSFEFGDKESEETKMFKCDNSKNRDLVVAQSLNVSPKMFLQHQSEQPPVVSIDKLYEPQVSDSSRNLVKEAIQRVQAAWQKTTEDRVTVLGEIKRSQIEQVDMTFAKDDSDDDDLYGEALIESENFVVYSNVEFLQLIGKYCAHCSNQADSGLKALNDYLLILDYNKGLMTRAAFVKARSQTMYHIGCIFYSQKEYRNAMRMLSPIIGDLKDSDEKKLSDSAAQKVAKIWQKQFNKHTVFWDYFAVNRKQQFGQKHHSLN